MTPNDLYSECAPARRKRTPSESMFFPLKPFKPDRYLEIPAPVHWKAGNRNMVRTNAAKRLIKKLGL